MAEASRRAARSARRGGLPNARFVVAAAEAPPAELGVSCSRRADHRLPWGSLLRGSLAIDGVAAAGIASFSLRARRRQSSLPTPIETTSTAFDGCRAAHRRSSRRRPATSLVGLRPRRGRPARSDARRDRVDALVTGSGDSQRVVTGPSPASRRGAATRSVPMASESPCCWTSTPASTTACAPLCLRQRRGRDRRSHLRGWQRRGTPGRREHARRARACRPVERRGRAGREVPLLARWTSRRAHGPRGLGYATPAACRSRCRPGSRRHRRRSTPKAWRDHPRDARARHQPRGRPGARAGPAATPSSVGVDGGAYRTPGNTSPTSEWNIHVDPGGGVGVRRRLVGGDRWAQHRPTHRPGARRLERAKFTPDHVTELARLAGSEQSTPDEATGSVASVPIVRFLADALRSTWSSTAGSTASTERSSTTRSLSQRRSTWIIRTEAVTVDVELTGELTTAEQWPTGVDIGPAAERRRRRRGRHRDVPRPLRRPRGRLAADRADVAI